MRKDTRFFISELNDDELINQIDALSKTITESDEKIFSDYVELTRHIIELDKLFYVFRYNLSSLLNHFIIYTNDLIVKPNETFTEEQNYYEINALTINLISSAKTLAESILTCMRNFLSKENFDSFKGRILSKPYDEYFSYRFLWHMRNYSQHGHLPVSIQQQRVYFDLNEILSMHHFDLNKKLKKEINELKKDIYEQFEDLPHISYVYTVARFNLVITEIYFNYLNEIKPILIEIDKEKNELLRSGKFQVVNSDGSKSNMVFFAFDGDGYHCFNSNDKSIVMYGDMKKEVKKILKKEKQYYKEMEIKNRKK